MRIFAGKQGLAIGLMLMTAGCPRRPLEGSVAGDRGTAAGARGEQAAATEPVRTQLPSGTNCNGRDDCPSDQVCMANICRYRNTSASGEIFARAAESQVLAGDWTGASRSYDQAIAAFTSRGRTLVIPPEILCRSAALLLRVATNREEREKGARRAFDCFRATLPNAREREEVSRAVARLRFEGLDIGAFDEAAPPARFFTAEPSRPTADAVHVTTAIRELEESTFAVFKTQLEGDILQRALAECFVSDWDERHEHEANASFVIRYSTTLRDLGTYDVFDGRVQVDPVAATEDSFSACAAEALRRGFVVPRASHAVAWQTEIDIHADMQQ